MPRIQLLSKIFLLPVLAAALFSLTTCSSGIPYPGIAYPPTYTYTPGRFVWRDLITSNPEASKRFYGTLFGWTFTTTGTGEGIYYLFRNNNETIGGMVKYPGDTSVKYTAKWICTLSSEEVGKTVKRCTDLGGSVIKKPYRVNGRGTLAVIRDRQGAVLVILNARDGDPFAKEAMMNTWLWTELWSNDPAGSCAFYDKMNGYHSEQTEVDGKKYWIFRDANSMVASMIENPLDNPESLWVPYIRVSDPATVVKKAKEAGAVVLLEPNPLVRKGSVAVLMDPGGAVFCVQKWPVE
ncbi:MAG TPA: VOC family protein [Bacteroidales bacterium]|nr:VOC family protein [Bacteroidales bacterium]